MAIDTDLYVICDVAVNGRQKLSLVKKLRSGENLESMFLIPAHSKRIPYVRNGLDEHFLTDRRGDHSSQVHLFTNPCVLMVVLHI